MPKLSIHLLKIINGFLFGTYNAPDMIVINFFPVLVVFLIEL